MNTETTPATVRVQTINQPSSYFSLDVELSAENLGEILGWNPGGEAIDDVLASLRAGRSRTVRTSQVPKDHGTACVEYLLSPITTPAAPTEPAPIRRLTGADAIAYAEDKDVPVCKHADPVECARSDLSLAEAREVAQEDAGLLYVDVHA
jgi:hypothetical protein